MARKKWLGRFLLFPFPFAVLVLFVALPICVPVPLSAQLTDADGLLVDIPEPPGAQDELPSPAPTVFKFMEALMASEFDTCLAHFDIDTFLHLMFSRAYRRLNESELKELFSYQVQVQRNEFRFLSRVMHRVAKGAKLAYTNPRFNKRVQSKIVVRLTTFKGNYEFVVYCRYRDGEWWVYDYVLNDQRFSTSFKNGLQGAKVDHYLSSLRPFYEDRSGKRTISNDAYDIALKVPTNLKTAENVSAALLASVNGFDDQFLLHVQAATYNEPQTLKSVAAGIKESIMPFQPRLYDQWKTDIAGVDIGHVLFHFLKNGKRLFTHMVIIPVRNRLVVLNFYHSTLQIMKHLTNLREQILDSLMLPRIEAAGGDLMIPSDDLTLPSDNTPTELEPYSESYSGGMQTDAPFGGYPGTDDDQGYGVPPDQYGGYGEPEIPPPPPDDHGMLQPNSYGEEDTYPEPPPPPDDYGEYGNYGDDGDYNSQQDEYPEPPPPPPPPPLDDYGDVSF